jgi:tRNA A-37 threonylcarbamoyl transferase component Bud32
VPQRQVEIRSVGGRLVAVKSATTEAEVVALTREADLLRRAAHPGVVAVVSFTATTDRAELVLRAPSDHTVAQRLPETVIGCLDFVSAVADIVADLHAIGIAHGAIRPDHVLVTANDQPVLCGFGNAHAVVDPELFAADVVALGELLAWLVRRAPEDRRGARIVASLLDRSRDRSVTARALAIAMVDARRQTGAARAGAKKPALGALVALGAIASGVAVFGDTGAPAATRVAPTTSGPSTTTSLIVTELPVVEIGGVTYQLGDRGDRAFFVPCEGLDRVVVLRPGSGDLFVFDELAAPGTPRTARSAGRVDGAVEVLPRTDGDCSEFLVATDDQLLPVPAPTTRSR